MLCHNVLNEFKTEENAPAQDSKVTSCYCITAATLKYHEERKPV